MPKSEDRVGAKRNRKRHIGGQRVTSIGTSKVWLRTRRRIRKKLLGGS